MNRAVRDTGWTALKRMLDCKAANLIVVPAKDTSQTCHECGAKDERSRDRRTRSKFRCVACGHRAHSDINAAKNIRGKALGMPVAASPENDAGDNGAAGEERAYGQEWADAGPGTGSDAKPSSPAPAQPMGPERTSLGRRRYPELVVLEPEPDDREVYGDAWPLVQEWREIWKAGHRGTGKGMAWIRAEERVRTLEVALLEEHGLTLPPEKLPLYGLDRRDQLVWRRKALGDARKSLARAELRGWLRRKLTFGLWRE